MMTKIEVPQFTQDEVQTAIDSFKRGTSSDNDGIRAEDIKTCDGTTKKMTRQIFNEVMKQEDCTPETRRRKRKKVIYKKRETRKKSETTARFALCQHCTNCSQHSKTTDPITDLTEHNPETRKGFGVPTKRWIILQHSDYLNSNARSGH